MKKLLLVAFAGLTLFAACDKDEEASSIEIVDDGTVLNGNTVNMKVWDQALIGVRRISDDSESLLYTWSSSDPDVVSIDPFGPVTENYCNIKAVGSGETVISVTADNGLVASYTIVVREIKATGIGLNDATVTFGGTITLTPVVFPDSTSFKNLTYTYESSNEKVAKIGADGKVETVGVGECKITVTTQDGAFSAQCDLTVKAIEVSSIEWSIEKRQSLTISVGELYFFEVTVTPDDATDQNIKWSSSDTEVATINNGVLTGVSAGECTITAMSSNSSVFVQWQIKVVE